MDSSTVYACLAILLAILIVRWHRSPLRSIPTVGGPSFPVLSLWTAFNFLVNAQAILAVGYRKFYGSTFKVAFFDKWLVVVSGARMVEDLRKHPEQDLSFTEGNEEVMQMKYTIGPDYMANPYHIGIIRDNLTRNLPLILPDVIDELKLAMVEHIPTKGQEWAGVDVMSMTQQVVARATNRVFVGLPLCRNQPYVDLIIGCTVDIVKVALTINLFPARLKPVIGYIFGNFRVKARVQRLLQPLVDERRAQMVQFGEDWAEKPKDMLQWVIEEVSLRKSPDSCIVERVVLINFAAIHTTSNSITHALYDLAAWPEHVKPLRDEIESEIASEGWTKAAMDKMWKLDSFLKESQRYNGISLLSMIRKAMKDVTMIDGTLIPKGTIVVAAAQSLHLDEANYTSAEAFDGFRFSRLRDELEVTTSAKHQFATTSPDYIPFGLGKRACPGRFFAASELKAMFAYIVLNYDLKLVGDKRPANVHIMNTVIPPGGKLMFRQRQRQA